MVKIEEVCQYKSFFTSSQVFAQFTGKHQCRSLFFNKVQDRRSPTCNFFLKKKTLAPVVSCEVSCKNFENLFYRTAVDDCFWIYENIIPQSFGIRAKYYTEVKRRGRSKIFLPTNIKYQRCTLVKVLF